MATDREVHRSRVLLDLPGFVGRRPDASVYSDGSRDTQQTVNTGRREPPAPTESRSKIRTHKSQSQVPCTPNYACFPPSRNVT